ncbi:PP2C family protein-serine/threonine phosphatase [Streptacidiphilus sp. N1-3]|uniref:PP2C family protein-serine/threonine phosphatase n=1 Tax=Streptacidiphilus alkalitolerans TaxID=3342712 RepID=A0ABV6WZJ8_9ACTN
MAESPSPRAGQTLDGQPLEGQPLGFPSPAAPPQPAPVRGVPQSADGDPAADLTADPLADQQSGPHGGPRTGRADDPLTDLTLLYELTERLTAATDLEEALHGVLQAGAAILGAQRGMLLLTSNADPHTPAFGTVDSPGTTLGFGLDRPALGALETVPRDSGPYAGLLLGESAVHHPGPIDETAGAGVGPAAGSTLGPAVGARFREVAAHLGISGSYALPLTSPDAGGEPFGAAVWFYDAPAAPSEHAQRLAGLYCSAASRLITKEIERDRLRRTADTLRRGLLPDRLPRVPGIALAARCLPAGLDLSAGSDWYDALALPDGSLALSVGSVTGGGPDCAAAMGRIRAALRAYAVLEGEDPVAVLGDLELLLKATEPARTATALYVYVDPRSRQLSLAGAGQCPPLLVTSFGASFVETSLSAPLGMLSCWEAPGVELRADRGDLLLLYTEGLARRCGRSLHSGQARLRSAAAAAPREVRQDPERFCAHLLSSCLGGSDQQSETGTRADDIVLLAARFE